MRYYLALSFAGALSFTLGVPAQACSVVNDYRVPTNLELAKTSPAILLGRVIGEQTVGESGWPVRLVVEPVEVIKGQVPPGNLMIEGSGLVPANDERGFGILSNPYELAEAHPLSYIGGCIRYMFPRGTTALFFVENEGENWRPAGGAFSRWAEDVLHIDDPWLKLTRLYVRAAQLSEAERKVLLEAELSGLVQKESDPVAQLMARDIARQLAGPNDKWNDMMRGMIGVGPENEAAAQAVAEVIATDLELDEDVTVEVIKNDGDETTLTAQATISDPSRKTTSKRPGTE